MSAEPCEQTIKMRTCKHCSRTMPLPAFKRDARARWGGYYFTCKDCHNARCRDLTMVRGSARARPDPIAGTHEKLRKLPPWEELRRLVVDEAVSYGEIARRYGVSKRGVEQTVRARAVRRGEWPLLTEKEIARRNAMAAENRRSLRVRGDIIRDLLIEFMDEHELTIKKMAEKSGIPWTRIRSVRSKDGDQMTIETASLILEAIGEPVPNWMKVAKRW